MGIAASILHGLISPDFAFLFFFVGLALIVIELLHPGISVPGILGGLLMVGAFVSFGLLPVQLIGIALLAASVGFFLLELKHPGVGLPLVAGVITLVLGGLFLFDRAVPNAQVSPWVIGPVAILLTLFFGFVVQAALRARHLPPPSHLQPEVGEEGVAETDLAPIGQVRIRKEPWSGQTAGRRIRAGTPVRVVGREGLKVIVEPVTVAPDAEGAPAGRSPAEQKGGMS
jgi:membrane-bound serine protease (ClpP class)